MDNPIKIGEGWRGAVFKGIYKGKRVAIKVAKREETEKAIRKEAELLEEIKGLKGVPQILEKGKDYFIYEFIEGEPFGKKEWSKEELKIIFSKLLDLCFLLDLKGIAHGELTNIEKNVLVRKKDGDLEVYLLDFERGRRSKKPRNVTQFMQVLRRYSFIGRDKAVEMGKNYIKDPEKVFKELKYLIEKC